MNESIGVLWTSIFSLVPNYHRLEIHKETNIVGTLKFCSQPQDYVRTFILFEPQDFIKINIIITYMRSMIKYGVLKGQ